MSHLLEHAVAEVRKLPDAEQDAIAALILEEIEDERSWEEALGRSPEKLAALAARAEEQVPAGGQLTSLRMPATETENRTVVASVVDSDEAGDPYCVVIPTSAATLAGFRAWSTSDAFPEHGKITFLGGEIIVDMSAERLGSHSAVRYAVTVVVGPLVEDNNRGRFYLDGARLVNEAAELSNEPDAMAVLFDSFKSGAVRDVPTADADDWIELEGSPDWVMEILSPGSVQKDTVKLRERYHRAGIAEYWLIDARRDRLKFTILIHHPGDYQPAPQVDGWQASKVFGKEFRLVRFADPRGRPAFRLEAR